MTPKALATRICMCDLFNTGFYFGAPDCVLKPLFCSLGQQAGSQGGHFSWSLTEHAASPPQTCVWELDNVASFPLAAAQIMAPAQDTSVQLEEVSMFMFPQWAKRSWESQSMVIYGQLGVKSSIFQLPFSNLTAFISFNFMFLVNISTIERPFPCYQWAAILTVFSRITEKKLDLQ